MDHGKISYDASGCIDDIDDEVDIEQSAVRSHVGSVCDRSTSHKSNSSSQRDRWVGSNTYVA